MPAKKSSLTLLPADRYTLTAQDKQRFAEERALGIVTPQNPILNQVAHPVEPKLIGSAEIQAIVDTLFKTAAGQQRSNLKNRKKRTLVGLAAPQIGEGWRIIMVDTKIRPDRKNPGHLECFINPEIVWRSRETAEEREGCFSAGPVWGLVRRPIAVKLWALTPEGQPVERIFENFTARVIQHECDHLDGIRFADRIKSDKKRHWVHTEEIPLYPANIRHWHRLCTRERWEQFKIEA